LPHSRFFYAQKQVSHPACFVEDNKFLERSRNGIMPKLKIINERRFDE
jgi:hypothetical protein